MFFMNNMNIPLLPMQSSFAYTQDPTILAAHVFPFIELPFFGDAQVVQHTFRSGVEGVISGEYLLTLLGTMVTFIYDNINGNWLITFQSMSRPLRDPVLTNQP